MKCNYALLLGKLIDLRVLLCEHNAFLFAFTCNAFYFVYFFLRCTHAFLVGNSLIGALYYVYLVPYCSNPFMMYFFEMYLCLFGRQLIDWCFVLCVLGALLQ